MPLWISTFPCSWSSWINTTRRVYSVLLLSILQLPDLPVVSLTFFLSLFPLSLVSLVFFGVPLSGGFDHRRLLCCLLVITRCWWSHQKKTSVCYRCCVYFTKGQAKVWNPQVFLSQKQRVRLIQCQLWNSDMKSVVCHRFHKRETWLFSSPFFNIMPKAIVCTGQKGKKNVSLQLSSVFCDEHVFFNFWI